ncbi:MAG TPA: serine hydrolase [Candidatus Baltobacteraceae bacterium]|jgi:beta-lactamase class A|nr:serine hydrolase [Candidatus Baltobacteraceae bacterium]
MTKGEKAGAMLSEDVVLEEAARWGIEPLSFVLRRLDVEEPGIAIAADRYLYPASMLKTPLALAVLERVAQGGARFEDRLDVTPANMTPNDLDSPLVPGYRASIDELLDLMITRSDNVATNMFYDLLGRTQASALMCARFGLHATQFHRKLSGALPLIEDAQWDGVHRNMHSASDAAHVFEAIARTRVPFAWKIHRLLMEQRWNNKLPGGLAPGDTFAHKTGDTDEVTHDGGILYTASGAAYVIVVYTGMESTEANNGKFVPFMRALRQHL